MPAPGFYESRPQARPAFFLKPRLRRGGMSCLFMISSRFRLEIFFMRAFCAERGIQVRCRPNILALGAKTGYTNHI